MVIGGEVPTVPPVPELRIPLVATTGVHAILDVQPFIELRPVIDVRQIALHLLPHGNGTERRRRNEALVEVGPQGFTLEGTAENLTVLNSAAAVPPSNPTPLSSYFPSTLPLHPP